MAYEYLLCDIATDNQLFDLTGVATAKISPRLSRPLTATFSLATDTPGLFATAYDGDPILSKGSRCVKVRQDGDLVANTKIGTVSWEADENTSNVRIDAWDPMQQLLSRTCFDATGRLADFQFPSPTTGAEMLQQVITNSVTFEDNVGTVAVLPIDYTGGIFSSTIDLSAQFVDTPMTIGDLISTLAATGVLDVVMVPVDTDMGADPGILAQMNVVDRWGGDLTGSVHFDFGVGDFNVAKATRSDSIDTLCNRLIYELGPKLTSDHWQGNITGTETTPINLSAWQADQLASRAKYGTFANVRLFDGAAENNARPLFYALWKAESTFRVYGRQLINITPAATVDATPYRPFRDYNVGDTFALNVAEGLLGAALTDQPQRIYGFDDDITVDGVETVSELIVSPDGL